MSTDVQLDSSDRELNYCMNEHEHLGKYCVSLVVNTVSGIRQHPAALTLIAVLHALIDTLL